MEHTRTPQETEQVVKILVTACCRVGIENPDALQSLLDAIYYMRVGRYPFNRTEANRG